MKDMRMRVAVVGAGMAGLSCADALARQGAEVIVFDKSRRPGGRLATRRAGDFRFDHGAQYATAHDPGFAALLARLGAAPWPEAGEGRWVGVPGMSALAAAFHAGIAADWRLDRHVAFARQDADGWWVRHMAAATVRPGTVTQEGGAEDGPFDAVLLALPAPQAASLLAAMGSAFADAVGHVAIAPCWALMLGFDARIEAPDTQRLDAGPLRWLARDSSRPGRAPLPDCWVAHAAPDWSREWLEQPAEVVSDALLAAFRVAAGSAAEPVHRAVHRWRYALTEAPLQQPCLWDSTAGLGVCGDWCLGARVEAAWLSGQALAAAVGGG